MQALVSVRTVDEALAVADAGVTMIDCKEPRAGALGALPPADIARIVRALRAHGFAGEISATIGDEAVTEAHGLLQALRGGVAERVARVAACGVDVVKVGVAATSAAGSAARLLDALADLPARVVPVLVADADGLHPALVQAACERFDALMVDTADKAAGSLLQIAPRAALQAVVEQARRHRSRFGLAGALRLDDLPLLRQLAPDFAGFRSVVCDADRGGKLSVARLRALLEALRATRIETLAASFGAPTSRTPGPPEPAQAWNAASACTAGAVRFAGTRAAASEQRLRQARRVRRPSRATAFDP